MFSRLVVKQDATGELWFAIEKEKLMYFVWLAVAIATGVVAAKAVRSFTA